MSCGDEADSFRCAARVSTPARRIEGLRERNDAEVMTTVLGVAFITGVLFILALDMGVLHRRAHTVSLREAALWSALWVGLAMLFAVGVFAYRGVEDGMQFLTGYVIELALSVDNVFLFLVIFSYFNVPAKHQHRVLFWGVLSAIVMRGAMIGVGAALLHRFHWILYVFGGFLILTSVKMFLSRNKKADPGRSPLVRGLRRVLPLTGEYDGQRFLTRRAGRWLATPLLLVLALVEVTDLIFATDSIPAIFAITTDTFIVFTSNILAVLGLRSLYFMLSGIIPLFHYLSVGLSAILVFVGGKMLGTAWGFHLPVWLSLLIIASILALSVAASVRKTRRQRLSPFPGKA
jgi:tellurite resistance protein TerC